MPTSSLTSAIKLLGCSDKTSQILDQYAQYKALADKEENVIFGGRLCEYKYYDMDQVIAAALEKIRVIN